MQLDAPVSPEAFSARLGALGVTENRIAVAVSGGRDSMALARLTAAHARKSGVEATALIVDHGLRDGSAREAAQAQAWCASAGLPARVLTWTGEKPTSGVQAAARRARYRLLAATANALGIGVILTGHTADDQAETVLMRLSRGAGPAGLAGMSEQTQIAAAAGDPVRLARPLLAFTRRQMTATVRAFDQDFIDDPSNEDSSYERARVRRRLQEAAGDGPLNADALLSLSVRMAHEAAGTEVAERREFRALAGVFTRWGGASLRLSQMDRMRGASPGLVRRLIRGVSGADYAPDIGAAADAAAAAVADGAATLGGALLKRHGEALWILREPGAVLGRSGVAPLGPMSPGADDRILWDRRFVIGVSKPGISVSPLGETGLKALDPATALFEGPREGLLAAPGLYCRGRLIGAPGLLCGSDGGWFAAALAAERFGGGIVRF